MVKRNKYGAIPVIVNGVRLDSKKEGKRYFDLLSLQSLGEIKNLVVHPGFHIDIKGKHICKVLLDFAYEEVKSGRTVYEDTKGLDTAISKLKRRMLEAAYNIKVSVL